MPDGKPNSRHFADLLDEMAAGRPGHEFLIHGEQRVTYEQFQVRAERAARGLYALGLRPGDRLALLISNRIEWFDMAFGAFQLGATVVPLTTWSRAWDLEFALKHSRAKVLVTLPEFRGNGYLDYLRELAPELETSQRDRLALENFPSVEAIVVLGAESHDGMWSEEEMLEAGATVSAGELAKSRHAAGPDDLAYILYTSGTTALPKGVMVEQGLLIDNAFLIGERQHLTADDRVWLAVSLGWGFAAENALPAVMSHGGTVVLQEHFDPAEALRLFEVERTSVVYVMPNIVRALLDHPASATSDRSALRTGAMIGAPEQLREAIEELGASELCNVYGATETYGNCCVTDCREAPEVRMVSQGRPLPGMRVRIVDPVTREPMPEAEPGEILVGGRVTSGYWDDAERTAEAFQSGEYVTGDLGYFDDEGRLHYTGRCKDVIKTGGINVAPAEVEGFLMTHDGVLEACVLGVPDDDKGEVVHAVLRLHQGAVLDASELRDYCRARIASYKTPDGFSFTDDDFPRTGTGKVNKADVLKLVLEGQLVGLRP